MRLALARRAGLGRRRSLLPLDHRQVLEQTTIRLNSVLVLAHALDHASRVPRAVVGRKTLRLSVPNFGRVRLQGNRLGSIIAMRCVVSIALQAPAAPTCRRQLYATIAIEP